MNSATVTRVGGTAQTYSDATSVAQYFTHAITAPDMLMQTDANALALATAYVTTRKETTIRIDSITLDLVTLGYGPGITAALDLDYFDTMQITNDGQGGSTIVKTLQCQGVAHDITPNTWVTVLTTQEALLDVYGSSNLNKDVNDWNRTAFDENREMRVSPLFFYVNDGAYAISKRSAISYPVSTKHDIFQEDGFHLPDIENQDWWDSLDDGDKDEMIAYFG